MLSTAGPPSSAGYEGALKRRLPNGETITAMATVESPRGATHEVFNQPPPLEDYNSFDSDRVLAEALRREGADWAEGRARELGAIAGASQTVRWGFEANEKAPKLHTHDRYGHRINEVEFDTSWHELMRVGIGHGLHALPWRQPGPGAHVARTALFVLLMQAESGVGCPISMTYSVIPALRKQPDVAEEWEPRFLSLDYDERPIPAARKRGALCGMWLTEKQGGSDVRANTTAATALNGGGPGAEYELAGHKWFCSAPMCDAFLVLAQAEGGLSCFLLPAGLPTESATPSGSSGSRTRWATARTPWPRWSSTAPGRGWSARRAAG